MLIYLNFSFNFVALDDDYFYNYFTNELIRWVVFTSFKHSVVRVL